MQTVDTEHPAVQFHEAEHCVVVFEEGQVTAVFTVYKNDRGSADLHSSILSTVDTTALLYLLLGCCDGMRDEVLGTRIKQLFKAAEIHFIKKREAHLNDDFPF